jgi:hypothetical protein
VDTASIELATRSRLKDQGIISYKNQATQTTCERGNRNKITSKHYNRKERFKLSKAWNPSTRLLKDTPMHTDQKKKT